MIEWATILRYAAEEGMLLTGDVLQVTPAPHACLVYV
ncbi:hypothetical protein PSAC2689_10511 [Paraburkholderia sacchari]